MKRLMILIVLVCMSSILYAQTKEQIAQEIKKYSNNIGFLQGSQKEKLKKQFPMCDEFLDVHWFKKQPNKLQRGWRKYTTAFDYKYDSDIGQYVKKKQETLIYELVEIQEDGHAEYYGIYFIRRAFPKTWKQVIQNMTITGNNKQFTFHYKGKKYDASKFKFKMADNYLNICVVKPDNKIALFYEMKLADRVLSDEEQNVLVTKISANKLEYKKEYFKYFTPIDINKDNIIDLQSISRPSGYYSVQQTYYESHREKYGIPEMKYVFPPKNLTCTVTLDNSFFYICEQSLFFQDVSHRKKITICNLTQLTTQKGEK